MTDDVWMCAESRSSGDDAAAAGSRAAVLVDGWEVRVLSADNATATRAGAAVVIHRREDDLLSLCRDGGDGESVHLNLGGWVWMNREA